MASIQDILRDAQHREEQDRLEAERRVREEEERRLAEIRRRQDEEEARLRAEEEDRQRRIFEEQRRQAELAAMQEATVQRARMEAEAQTRLAEMAARQEHERKLQALKQDKGKRTLKWIAIGTGVFLVVALVGGGIGLKMQMDKNEQARIELEGLRSQIAKAESERAKLKNELETTKDPQRIAELTKQLQDKDKAIEKMNQEVTTKPKQGGFVGGGGGAPPAGGGPKPPAAGPKSNCAPGDPLCSF